MLTCVEGDDVTYLGGKLVRVSVGSVLGTFECHLHFADDVTLVIVSESFIEIYSGCRLLIQCSVYIGGQC